MTTEQLNIIITAQTADFTEKLGAVNTTLRETITLAERAAASAAKVTDPEGESAGEAVSGSAAEGIYQAPAAAGTSDGFPKAPNGSARAAVFAAGDSGDTSGAAVFSPALAAASVLRLDRSQTLVGAVSGSGNEQNGQNKPIEIRTTIELDGDRIGEAVSAYNERRSRITDGFTSR